MPQTITATIASVNEGIRTYDGKFGKMASVEGEFRDGTCFASGVKPEHANLRLTDLKALIGRECQYEVEPGKDFGGKKWWRLKSWPGRELASGGGPGGGTKGTRGGFGKSAEERDDIHRSVALQQAIAFCGPQSPQSTGAIILAAADQFYGWLTRTSGDRSFPIIGDIPSTAPLAGANPSPPTPLAGDSRPPTCPACNKTEAVFKDKHKENSYFCWKAKGGCGHNWTPGERLLPGVAGSRSLLEDLWNGLDKAQKVLEVVGYTEKIADGRKSQTLEGQEMYRLDKFSAEKAVAVAKSNDELYVAEGFLKQLRDQKRLTDSDYMHHMSRLTAKREQKASIEEMEVTF